MALDQGIFDLEIRLHKAIVGNRYPHEPQDFRRPSLCVCRSMLWVRNPSALAAFSPSPVYLNSLNASRIYHRIEPLVGPNRLLSFPQECTNNRKAVFLPVFLLATVH